MKNLIEDFLHLFFPKTEVEDKDKTPLGLKVLGFILIAIVTVFALIVLG